jgi:uncharacterized membrane protein
VAWGQHDVAVGAVLLFLTNAVAIALAGAVIFLLLGFGPAPERRAQRKYVGKALRSVSLSALLVVATLVALSWRLQERERAERAMRRELTAQMAAYSGQITEVESAPLGTSLAITVTATLPETGAQMLDAGALERVRTAIASVVGRPVRLNLTIVPVRVLKAEPGATEPRP